MDMNMCKYYRNKVFVCRLIRVTFPLNCCGNI